jgi:polysaccharide export outer membrane protein
VRNILNPLIGIFVTLCMAFTVPRVVAQELQSSAKTPSSWAVQANGTTGPNSYRVGQGDVLTVQVYDEADLSGEFEIGQGGGLDYPLIGWLKVETRTVQEIAALLQRRLGQSYLVNPQVNVRVSTYASQPVKVIGAVVSPGVFYLERETTLLEMVATAGGVVSESSMEVHLMRGGQGKPAKVIPLDLLFGAGEGNEVLRSGDVVYIPEGLMVYVAGEVNEQGAIAWHDGLTVTQALARAGGTTATAKLRDAYILRNGDRILVNVKRVIHGTDPDLRLEAGDQLFVQESVF